MDVQSNTDYSTALVDGKCFPQAWSDGETVHIKDELLPEMYTVADHPLDSISFARTFRTTNDIYDLLDRRGVLIDMHGRVYRAAGVDVRCAFIGHVTKFSVGMLDLDGELFENLAEQWAHDIALQNTWHCPVTKRKK